MMTLYLAEVNWYNEDCEEDHVDTVVGFAKDVVQFVDHINNEFPYIESMSIKTINPLVSQNELLYITSDMVDKIIEENDY